MINVCGFLHLHCLLTGKNGKTQNTPSKAGGDRFIPTRNNKQMDVASFLISKENEPVEEAASSSAVRPCSFLSWSCFVNHRHFLICLLLYRQPNQKAWSVTLNGYDIEEAKILHLGGKPLNAPEGMVVPLNINAIPFINLYCVF